MAASASILVLTPDLESLVSDQIASGRFQTPEEVVREALRAFAAADVADGAVATRAILEGIGDGFFAIDRNWRITYFNRAAEAFFQRDRGDMLGRNLFEAVPGYRGTEFERRYMRAMDKRESDEFELPSAIWPDRWVEVRVFPTEEGLGVSFRDVTCRKENERKNRRAEVHNRALVEATAAIVWSRGPGGESSDPMPRWQDFTGQTPEQYAGFGWLDAVHPDDRSATRAAWQRAIDTAEPYSVEHRIRRRDGQYRYMAAKAVPLLSPEGIVEEWVGIHTDITETKKAQAHQQLLIDELNHRVKNTLATVLSVASQTLRTAETVEQGRVAFAARLLALAKAHDILTQENWQGAGLSDVVAGAIEPYETGQRFRVEGPSLRLLPKAALSIAMALHELATNAVKYGSLSGDQGSVAVTWSVETVGDKQVLRLVWQEVGGPPVEQPGRRGFGSRLLERGLAGEFDGRAEINYDPTGVVCRIEASLAAVVSPGLG